MADPKQLPFLIDLLEDESEYVRQHVIRQLAAFGSTLEPELRRLAIPINDEKVRIILYQVEDFLRNFSGLTDDNRLNPYSFGECLYKPGQLIRHKRYSYRGVIVDHDPVCMADDDWYADNAVAPPAKNQPWYYVFVHLTSRVTYAAQSSLITDDSTNNIVHPLLMKFFSSFEKGAYIRNQKTWPKLYNGEPPKG